VGNIWSRQSKLLAKDGAGGDYFGVRVSIYDTTSMIGAYCDDDKAVDAGIILYLHYKCVLYYILCYIVYLGSVYVYGSVGNIWSRQSKLLAADGAGSDNFGYSVSVYSTTTIVGANRDDDQATDAGI
jgi:hypothetical protein